LTQYIPEGGIEAQLKFEDDSDAEGEEGGDGAGDSGDAAGGGWGAPAEDISAEGEFGAEKGTDAPAAAW
jgi:hypothetical protein